MRKLLASVAVAGLVTVGLGGIAGAHGYGPPPKGTNRSCPTPGVPPNCDPKWR